MKSVFYSAAIVCLAIGMLASCGNKDDDATTPKTPTELFAGDFATLLLAHKCGRTNQLYSNEKYSLGNTNINCLLSMVYHF